MSESQSSGNPSQQPAESAAPSQPSNGSPAEAELKQLASLQAELHQAREELAASRREQEQQGKRLDEIARAYSGLLNDQKEFRGRLEREKDRVLETERGKVALGLLEMGDELERALSAAKGDEGPLAQGVRLIRDGLIKRLSAMGIERLELKGKPFDPTLAEAVDMVPVTDQAMDDTVVTEVAAGYRLGERVLRPGRVRVGRYVAAQQQQASSPNGEVQ